MPAMPGKRLPLSFYERPTEVVARELIGKRLVHGERSGFIVETEAYLGPEDLASHARFGPTARNRVMFGRGGIAYVYLCYGMYQMLNVVTDRDGQPGAVLIRGLEPAAGLPADPAIARGPGKLTRALGITREHNGIDLVSDDRLFLTQGSPPAASAIATGPRIGVDYAGEWAQRPMRFWIAGHPSVSRPPRRRDPSPKKA